MSVGSHVGSLRVDLPRNPWEGREPWQFSSRLLHLKPFQNLSGGRP